MRALYLLVVLLFLTREAYALNNEHLGKKELQQKHENIQNILKNIESKRIVPAKLDITPEIKIESVKLEGNYVGPIKFLTKVSSLWVKDSLLTAGKKPNDFVEITLPGELYEPHIVLSEVVKTEVNRKTIQGAVESAFSANKHADIDWIVQNFIQEEQKRARFFFKDKNILEDSKRDANEIVGKYITGKLSYKGDEIVFVEQDYGNGKKIIEAITLKKEKEEYKITNSLTEDEVYDLIFAAISTGTVMPAN